MTIDLDDDVGVKQGDREPRYGSVVGTTGQKVRVRYPDGSEEALRRRRLFKNAASKVAGVLQS